ncbi:MAG TPA: hypothetical protein VFM21_00705 [Terriglobia bacterium]|nr:hypothetical protein [Terriglobia bacterium]
MRVFRAIAAFTSSLVLPASLYASLDLPQIEARIKIQDSTVALARGYWRGVPRSETLPVALQKGLIQSLPAELTGGCRQMISYWGQIAEGTERWSVRSLHAGGNTAWIAFRCGSTAHEYAESYDERLAVLRLDEGILEFVPVRPVLEGESFMFHLKFDEELPLPAGTGIAFRLSSSTDNPCCDGGDRSSEDRLIVFATDSGATRQVLSVVIGRDDYSHDDVDGDGETVYKAQVHFESDASDHVIAATASFREQVKNYDLDGNLPPPQPSPRVGELKFIWDNAAGRFVEAPQNTGTR